MPLAQKRSQVTKTLVAIDGSPASTRAVKLAINQMKSTAGANLVLANVQNLGTLGVGDGVGIMPLAWIEKEEAQAATQALQDAVTACREAGVACVSRSERGPVATTIDRVAREEHVVHIIMGTRGLGGVRSLLLGSVTTQLLHLVDVPVTLVKQLAEPRTMGGSPKDRQSGNSKAANFLTIAKVDEDPWASS